MEVNLKKRTNMRLRTKQEQGGEWDGQRHYK